MSRRLPPLNALKAFEAAARHESFTKAAAELHVSHAAISRHVRDLEEWLGVDLFRRMSRGVQLTDAGGRYAAKLTGAFDEMQAATLEIAVPGKAAGSLSVSLEVAFAVRWLVPRLGDFQKLYPDIDLELDPTKDLVDFRNSDAELAIRYGSGDWPDVEVTHLVDLMAFPVCSPSLLGGQKKADVEILKEHRLIHEETRRWWALWLKDAGIDGVDPERGPLLQDMHLAVEAAAAGQGFALADNLLVKEDLASGKLVKPFDIETPGGAYYIVRPKGLAESPSAKAFREWLQAEIARASQDAIDP